jgi:hypothetical membrane protein
MSTCRRAVTGALLLIIGPVVFWTAETLTASAWSNPGYSFRWDAISDLGNPVPHDFMFGHTVNSPLYFVMNFGFAVAGILWGSAVIILHRLFAGRARIAILLTGMLEAVGLLVISEFHQQSVSTVEMGVHWVGAFLILIGAVTIVLVGVSSGPLGAPRWYRLLSVIVGASIFGSFIALVTIPPVATVIGGGAVERVAMWGGLCWQIITGITLLAGTRRPPSSTRTPPATSALRS